MPLSRRWFWLAAALALLPLAAGRAEQPSGPAAGGARLEGLPDYFRQPSEVTRQELQDQLPADATIARIPGAYRLRKGRVVSFRPVEAILYGDVDGDGRREFVVGCYFRSEIGSQGPRDDRARLAVFKLLGGHWALAWTSPGLGYEFDRPRNNVEEVEKGIDRVENLQPPVQLVNVGGTDQLGIAYFAWSESASVGALPGVYRWSGSRWRNVAPQAERFTLRDLNGDGSIEVVAGTRYIGYGSGDDDVPRVYRWSADHFEEASSLFPGFYSELAQSYRDYLRRLEGPRRGAAARDVWQRALQKAESLSSPVPPSGS
jgi:hypothetical protein